MQSDQRSNQSLNQSTGNASNPSKAGNASNVDNFDLAKRFLLEPANLNENSLERVLSNVLGHSVDYADIYFQSSRQETFVLEDGIIKEGGFGIDYGAGVRAVSGEKTGFAYSDEIILPALEKASNAARSIAHQGEEKRVQVWQRQTITPLLYTNEDPLQSMKDDDKVALLKRMDKKARSLDSRVTKVMVSLTGSHEIVLVVGTDGTFCADVRPLVRLNVTVIVEENGRREQASCGGGGRGPYSMFLKDDDAFQFVEEAVRIAVTNLRAVPAPAGLMTVVLGPGWPGVLLHEAVGHGLEGDFNRKGHSAFAGKVGERVASPLCTVVDDGTLVGRRGSLNFDDEGVGTQYTTLIENGILKGYMQDKLNARLMGVQPTGNGRRESYAHLPMPRMTNTYLLPGESDPEEIIASVDKGLYAVTFGGGQVDITSGKFVFNANEAYRIEKGKIVEPVKGATLIGNGPEILFQVSMVGNDLQLDRGIGTCGKEGQSVPVGVGQPTLKIDAMTVGGTEQ